LKREGQWNKWKLFPNPAPKSLFFHGRQTQRRKGFNALQTLCTPMLPCCHLTAALQRVRPSGPEAAPKKKSTQWLFFVQFHFSLTASKARHNVGQRIMAHEINTKTNGNGARVMLPVARNCFSLIRRNMPQRSTMQS